MTAEIKKYGNCLWLEINSKHDETAWAIAEEEIQPIMEACMKYLKIDIPQKEEESD